MRNHGGFGPFINFLSKYLLGAYQLPGNVILTEKSGTCEWKVNKTSSQLAGVLQSNWGRVGTGLLPKAESHAPLLVVTVLGFAMCLEKCDFWGFRKESFHQKFYELTTKSAVFF